MIENGKDPFERGGRNPGRNEAALVLPVVTRDSRPAGKREPYKTFVSDKRMLDRSTYPEHVPLPQGQSKWLWCTHHKKGAASRQGHTRRRAQRRGKTRLPSSAPLCFCSASDLEL